MGRARRHPQRDAEIGRGPNQLEHAWEEGLGPRYPQLVLEAPGVQALPFQGSTMERLEVGHGVKAMLVRSDHLGPDLRRQLQAVVAVELLPGFESGRLGVDDEAVEIEDQGADHLDFETIP